jgi:hypothetical protein
MHSADTSTTLQGCIFIDAASKLKLNIKAPGLHCLLWCGDGIELGPLNLSIGKFTIIKLPFSSTKKVEESLSHSINIQEEAQCKISLPALSQWPHSSNEVPFL